MEAFDQIAQSIFAIDKYSKLYLRNALKPYDLNLSDGMILLCYFERNKKTGCKIIENIASCKSSKTQEQLIGQLHFDKSVAARTMQGLEQKGYLVRKDNPNDKRSYLFSITEKGCAFESTLTGIVEEWHNVLAEGVDDATLEIINNGLKMIAEKAIEKSKHN